MRVFLVSVSALFLGVLAAVGARSGVLAQESEASAWDLFARTTFSTKYFKEADEYFLSPVFSSGISQKEGKPIELKGYFIPFDLDDRQSIIVSRVPYTQCFFCGGAGPESVAEVQFTHKVRHLSPDEVITVRGILRLNANDVNHLNFILENAELISGKGR